MYEVVAQEGIVLGKRGIRESDILVSILTSEGLLRARALGARMEKSKLRYSLESLTSGRFTFVRGKHELRLTGVTDISRAFLSASPSQKGAMARVARLLLRLVPGQEPSAELFSTVKAGFETLMSAVEPSSVEVVLVLRVLSHLGYLPRTEALAPYVDGEFSMELSAQALRDRAVLVRAINESLKATGL